MADEDAQASGSYRRMEDAPSKADMAASGAYSDPPAQQDVPYAYAPPAAAPQSVAPAVVTQPTRTSFDVNKMDAASLQLYSGLAGTHMSSDRLLAVIHTAGGQIVKHIDNTTTKLKVSSSTGHAQAKNMNLMTVPFAGTSSSFGL